MASVTLPHMALKECPQAVHTGCDLGPMRTAADHSQQSGPEAAGHTLDTHARRSFQFCQVASEVPSPPAWGPEL